MKLPNQHRYHIQAKRSIHYIESLIPSSWIIRQINPDYGIDLEIEIWNDDPTGRIIYIQVKSIEKYPENAAGTYRIKKSTLNYLNQRPNSYILFIIHEYHFEILRVSDLISIYVDNFCKNNDSKYVNIPLVTRRNYLIKDQKYYYDGSGHMRLGSILGWEYYINVNKYTIRNVPYISYFSNESDFWRFETYWTIGNLYHRKREHNSIARKLLKQYEVETIYGKAGILGALSLLEYSSEYIQKQAEILLDSNEPIVFLVAIMNLIVSNSNRNLDFVNKLAEYIINHYKGYFIKSINKNKLFKYPFLLMSFDYHLFRAIECTAAVSLSTSRTKKGIKYFVNNFLKCNHEDNLFYYSENLWYNIKKNNNYKDSVIEVTKELLSWCDKDEKYIIHQLEKMSSLK